MYCSNGPRNVKLVSNVEARQKRNIWSTCIHPILQYPDPERPYVLFTDASKYRWAGVLTQPYDEIDESTQSNADPDATPKKTVIHHPVTYISGLFRGSQLNWAALTKEAYAINLSVQKLSFYLTNADVLIRSNHLPLKNS